jgi:hypothetical protein
MSNSDASVLIDTYSSDVDLMHRYHVDGLVLNHELKVVWPSVYVGGSVMEFGTNRFIGGVSCDPTDPLTARLQRFMHDCLGL